MAPLSAAGDEPAPRRDDGDLFSQRSDMHQK